MILFSKLCFNCDEVSKAAMNFVHCDVIYKHD